MAIEYDKISQLNMALAKELGIRITYQQKESWLAGNIMPKINELNRADIAKISDQSNRLIAILKTNSFFRGLFKINFHSLKEVDKKNSKKRS